MSHGHSHSDGDEGHSHSHSHSHSQGPPQPQSALPPPSDVDGLITIHPLNVTKGDDAIALTISAKDADADAALKKELDALTALSRDFLRHKISDAPPPPQTSKNQRSTLVMHAKEEGNTLFKKGKFNDAVSKYSMSAQLASTRPLFEAAVYAREELALTLCNRCAAYTSAGKFTEALADAEAVIKIKRPWTKGHFRKGKCLVAMGRFEEAKEAFLLGLEFDPSEKDLLQALEDVDTQAKTRKKLEAKK